MEYTEKPLADKICLDLCDGRNGKCQRYPIISKSCEEFTKLKKAYKTGMKDSDMYEALKSVKRTWELGFTGYIPVALLETIDKVLSKAEEVR